MAIFDDQYRIAKEVESKPQKINGSYFSDLVLLARLWYTENKTEDFISSSLLERLAIVYPDLNQMFMNERKNDILAVAKSKSVLKETSIIFSHSELDYIHSFNDLDFEKFLFIMFAAYKVEDFDYFSISKNQIKKYAKINRNLKIFDIFFRNIEDYGLFTIRPYDLELKYRATEFTKSLYKDDDILLIITNSKNLIYYYLQYIGQGSYLECEECGCIEHRKAPNQKYCDECAASKRLEKHRKYNQKRNTTTV